MTPQRRLWAVCILLSIPVAAQNSGTITTFAGSGTAGFSGDGGPAINASFNRPVYVHGDPTGNIYVADENNARVRRINPEGRIDTFAGSGARAFSGDGGPATAAALNGVNGVCSDRAGNIYLNDTGNNRVRRVDRAGVITTFAGNGMAGTSGDGGVATSAGIWLPIRCDFDSSGAMYLAEQGGHRVRKITASGIISTFAGTGSRGFSGDGGPATAAQLDNPTAVAVDGQGNVFITDQGNHRIRRVTAAGLISTYAGTGSAGFSGDAGPATSAMLNFPGGICIDQGGTLYLTDGPNQRARRIWRDGIISTIAGTGTAGFSGDNGPATAAQINAAFGIALDSAGNVYLADTFNNRIRKIGGIPPLRAPSFTSTAVVNAGSFAAGLTPGGLATIFGRDLSTANGIVVTSDSPWPTRLLGTSVLVNGTAAPVYSLATVNGTEQISFQAPYEIQGGAPVNVVVDNNGSRSVAATVTLLPVQPGIFLVDGVNGAFLHANFQLVSASNPAVRGETLLAFLTGLGAVSPAVASGAAAPSAETFARTITQPVVTVGGRAAVVSFSGLAPGYIGLYQVNFTVPSDAPTGAVDVVVSAAATTGNTAKLEIQ